MFCIIQPHPDLHRVPLPATTKNCKLILTNQRLNSLNRGRIFFCEVILVLKSQYLMWALVKLWDLHLIISNSILALSRVSQQKSSNFIYCYRKSFTNFAKMN